MPRRGGNHPTHCPKGHEYSSENTYLSKDGRRRSCRACHAITHGYVLDNLNKFGRRLRKK